jgi:type IV secretory pathway ATPase VirB11/archaellum biosynthesis ATPase
MRVTLHYLLEPVSCWLDDQAVEEVCINGPGEASVYARRTFARHEVWFRGCEP